MVGRYALNLESSQAFVNIVASYKVRGIPLEDIGAYPARIAATTPESLLSAADAFVPANFVIIVAGNAEVLQPQLEAVGRVSVVEPR
jgi:predicted Zn-dependent peptidase